MKYLLLKALFGLQIFSGFSRKVTVRSSNQKISIALFNQQNADTGDWYLKVNYTNDGKTCQVIPRIDLELLRSDQDFSKDFKFRKIGKPILINEQYAMLHGKRSKFSNSANEIVINFENAGRGKLFNQYQ